MLKVGLTGGIGSGKTTIAKIFALLGVPVFNADDVAKHIMQSNSQVINKIKQHFGNEVYVNNQLNRQLLASMVFNNPTQLQLLNAIVHPATIAAANSWMQQQTAAYCIKEAALLFEAGTAEGLNIIIGVYTPDTIRIQRAMQRDGSSREQIIQRMNKQIPESIKMKLCDKIINNSNHVLVIPQVVAMHQQLLMLANG